MGDTLLPDGTPPASVPVKVPFDGVTGSLDVEDIRHGLMARTIEDNPLELDLEFSDDEIGWAFRHAAMMFNALPPHVYNITSPRDVTDQRLTYSFMLAVYYHLCLAKAMKLQRTNIDYSAGDMQADFTKRRIEYLTKWSKVFQEQAAQGMQNYKLVVNLNQGFAHF